MIPQVAASERGIAQTDGVPALSGLRDRDVVFGERAEQSGKAGRSG